MVTFTHIVKIYRKSCLPSFFIVYVTKIDDVTACFLVLCSRRIFGERVYYNYPGKFCSFLKIEWASHEVLCC